MLNLCSRPPKLDKFSRLTARREDEGRDSGLLGRWHQVIAGLSLEWLHPGSDELVMKKVLLAEVRECLLSEGLWAGRV